MADTALWNKKDLAFEEKTFLRHFPTEYMLRSLISSSYFKNMKQVETGQSVLDIGCLYANNLVPFADRGCNLYGVEVTDDAVNLAREMAERQGLKADIRKGVNSSLPFEDDFFDFVLSISTIHYEESKDGLIAALNEMKRVLKPGGCLLVSSAGQEHEFVSTAKKHGPNQYTAQWEGDFRTGQTFAFFDGIDDFKDTLSGVFETAEIAVITETYPCSPLQFYIGKCFK